MKTGGRLVKHARYYWGYQTAYGHWEGGPNFPHGMKWLAGKIHDLGLKPGIWVAPYCITEGTEPHQQHPEWLIRELDGSIRTCYKAPEISVAPEDYEARQFMKNIYGLDITHPGAMEWMGKLFDTIANDWGYDFIKIDFVEWTLLAAGRYHDASLSKATAYRRGFETMRQAIGPHRHLLDCGPMNNTIGLLDSTRIELDYRGGSPGNSMPRISTVVPQPWPSVTIFINGPGSTMTITWVSVCLRSLRRKPLPPLSRFPEGR